MNTRAHPWGYMGRKMQLDVSIEELEEEERGMRKFGYLQIVNDSHKRNDAYKKAQHPVSECEYGGGR